VSMRLRSSPTNTAKTLQQAVKIAETQLNTDGHSQTKPAFVDLRPDQIEMRPELFQPREFSFGTKDTDKQYVKKLAGEIETAGQLDPILVIRLGEAWVCVDGHHRARAYELKKWEGTIKCEWFGGSVREAVDEGMRRNRTVKLEVHRADRQEQAWKRVLLGWGSKSEIVRLCGVSEGIVAHMRRVKALANDPTEQGEAFRQRLGLSITEKSWSLARLAYEGAERKQIGIEELAGRLAREIGARLQGKLSEDPAVTARALAIYDPELPAPLTKELLEGRTKGTRVLREILYEAEKWRQTPTTNLEEALKEIKEELDARREAEALPLPNADDLADW
jgi:hypothetical protein